MLHTLNYVFVCILFQVCTVKLRMRGMKNVVSAMLCGVISFLYNDTFSIRTRVRGKEYISEYIFIMIISVSNSDRSVFNVCAYFYSIMFYRVTPSSGGVQEVKYNFTYQRV